MPFLRESISLPCRCKSTQLQSVPRVIFPESPMSVFRQDFSQAFIFRRDQEILVVARDFGGGKRFFWWQESLVVAGDFGSGKRFWWWQEILVAARDFGGGRRLW